MFLTELRALTNVGRTCGPTLLLVHLYMYVKAINMFKFKLTDFYILMNEGKSVKIPLKYLHRSSSIVAC